MNAPATDLILTDEQWGHIAELTDYTDYTAAEFDNVLWILLDARETLNYTPSTPPGAAMAGLDAIELWDTGDNDSEDLILTVSITGALTLATNPIKITAFRADVPKGPAAARFALEQILTRRNELVQALSTYTVTGAAEGAAPKDASIIGDVLICPHCTRTDSIVEIDYDLRRNPVYAGGADVVAVHQQDTNYRTARFECSACGGQVTMPYEVTH